MGKFLLFAAAGFGAAMLLDSYRSSKSGSVSGLGQIHRGFIPLETARATLPNASKAYAAEARLAYQIKSQQGGLGQIDYFLM